MPLSSTFNLGVLARTKNSMHPRGSRYPSSPVPPLYPMHTRGPLRPLPDGVPHRVVDAWRDLRVWGGVDVEVGGLRPPPAGGLRARGSRQPMKVTGWPRGTPYAPMVTAARP